MSDSTYIVRHDDTSDFPTTWAFTEYSEAAKLRDKLNEDNEPAARQAGTFGPPDYAYHVEEEVHQDSAHEVIEELRDDGWFE